MVSAETNRGPQSGHCALVPWQAGMAQRKAQSETLDVCLGSEVSAATKWKARSAALYGDPGRPSSAAFASMMLLNPVTSTPFSVNDILRLESEQIGPEVLQFRGPRRSGGNSQYLRRIPEQRESEVSCTGSFGDSDRRQKGEEPPGGPCETLTEMDAEPVGEPRKYTHRSWLLGETKGWGWITNNWCE